MVVGSRLGSLRDTALSPRLLLDEIQNEALKLTTIF